MSVFRVNLGGEGEVPRVLNQQPRGVLSSTWLGSQISIPFVGLVAQGLDFLLCDNTDLSFPDETIDEVITNAVPVDSASMLGPGVQTSEVQRILKPGGIWIHDGVVVWTKP